MDTLELLLRDEENFKQGVYWCIRRGADISGRLKSLLRRDRVYLVSIEGFDEFMAELHSTAQVTLPRAILQPLEMAKDRARLFIEVEDSLESHPVIGAHIREVLEGINTHNPKLPLPVEATRLSLRGEFDAAIPIWKEAYEEEPTDAFIAYQYADVLADAGKNAELAEFIPKSPLSG